MQTRTRGHGATLYVADMRGARLVLASEVPENRSLNESVIKDLTGGATLTVLYLLVSS